MRSFILKIALLKASFLGWLWAKWANPSGLFFFFPYASIGGAEQVHVDILSSISKEKPWVFIRTQKNASLAHAYKQHGRLFFLDRLYLFPKFYDIWFAFWKQFFISFINSKKNAKVIFWHQDYVKILIPHLKPHIQLIDIVHNLRPLKTDDEEYLNLSLVPVLTQRVVITPYLKEVLTSLYEKKGMSSFSSRIHVINNAVDIPISCPKKNLSKGLNVIIVARPVDEKRLYLCGKIALLCQQAQLPISFTFVGGLEEQVAQPQLTNSFFISPISEKDKLYALYASHHIILLTSSSEGFPMVFMEAMANGVIPISSAVGGIPAILHPAQIGFVSEEKEEEKLVFALYEWLEQSIAKPAFLQAMSEKAYLYAKEHFNRPLFKEKYRHLLGLSPTSL